MKITYDDVYALCYLSFETQKEYVDTIYADKELAEIAAKIKDQDEHNGLWRVKPYYSIGDNWLTADWWTK